LMKSSLVISNQTILAGKALVPQSQPYNDSLT
jgi:hypothetical protein